jgi:Beta-lactamase
MSTGGLSRAQLERMQDVMAGYVDRGVVPGVVTLVSRRGEVQVDATGTKAYGDNDPMRRDMIFRVASVTKPIVAAAAMILVEECALDRGDKVTLSSVSASAVFRSCRANALSPSEKLSSASWRTLNWALQLPAGHEDRLHRTSPPPKTRRKLLRYMRPATMESPKPA